MQSIFMLYIVVTAVICIRFLFHGLLYRICFRATSFISAHKKQLSTKTLYGTLMDCSVSLSDLNNSLELVLLSYGYSEEMLFLTISSESSLLFVPYRLFGSRVLKLL